MLNQGFYQVICIGIQVFRSGISPVLCRFLCFGFRHSEEVLEYVDDREDMYASDYESINKSTQTPINKKGHSKRCGLSLWLRRDYPSSASLKGLAYSRIKAITRP